VCLVRGSFIESYSFSFLNTAAMAVCNSKKIFVPMGLKLKDLATWITNSDIVITVAPVIREILCILIDKNI
jgi:hypothetical protein